MERNVAKKWKDRGVYFSKWQKSMLVAYVAIYFLAYIWAMNLTVTVSVYFLFAAFATYLLGSVCNCWCNQYLYYEKRERNGVVERKTVVEVLKVHPFDADTYFDAIREKMWYISLLVLLLNIVFMSAVGFLKDIVQEKNITAIVVSFLLLLMVQLGMPYGIWYLKKKEFVQVQYGKRGIFSGKLYAVLKTILWTVARLLDLLILLFVGVAFAIILPAMVNTCLDFVPMPNDVIMNQCRQRILGTIAVMIGYLVFLAVQLGGVFPKREVKKKTKRMLTFGFVLLPLVPLLWETYNHTDFYEDKAVAYHFFQKKEYVFSQGEKFEVYYDSKGEQPQIRLFFADGTVLSTQSTTQSATDAFEQTYTWNCNWLLAIAKKCKAGNLEGKIIDADQIEKALIKYDHKEELDAWFALQELLDEVIE